MSARISLQSLTGKSGIPTPYIKKVTLSPASQPAGMDIDFGKTSSSSGLLVTLELVLVDIKRGRKDFTWANNDRLLRNLRLKVIESRDEDLTALLSDGGFTAANLKQAKLDTEYQEKVIDLKSRLDIDSVQKIRRGRNTTVFMIPYEVQFFIPNLTPDHLAYFCSCYIDTRGLTENFGARFKNKRFREVQGFVTGELVIAAGRPRTDASIFKLPKGDIWTGAVHYHQAGGTYMAGPRHTNRPHPKLKRSLIPNFKIQDNRVFDLLDSYMFNLQPGVELADKIINSNSSTAPSSLHGINQAFVSNAFISRDPDGKSNLVFSVDFLKILERRGQFGKLLGGANSDAFEEMKNNSRISMFKLLRKRVKDNNFTENPSSKHQLFDNSASELIVGNAETIAGQFPRKIRRKRIDGEEGEGRKTRIGFAKEINILNTGNSRTFSCTDFSMSRITDGKYQYEVELEIEDGTITYLINTANRLKRQKAALRKYHSEAVLKINYDAVNNRFKNRFININNKKYPELTPEEVLNLSSVLLKSIRPSTRANAPWNQSIATLVETLSVLTDMPAEEMSYLSSNIHAMVNPATGTPDGILMLIKAYERVEDKIYQALGDRSLGTSDIDMTIPGASSVHKEKFKKSVISVNKTFNQTFDSDVIKKVGYDFLGGKKTNRGGMREITTDFYNMRVSLENDKYYTASPSTSPDPIQDTASTAHTYLTPARVKMGTRTLRILNSGASLWDNKKYNRAAHMLALMNLDPTRDKLSAPLGSKQRFKNQKQLEAYISTSILSRMGVTIEPFKTRGPRTGLKEEVTAEDILPETTLATITDQAVGIVAVQDVQATAEVEGKKARRQQSKFSPLNTFFVESFINKEGSTGLLESAEDRNIAPGISGFDLNLGNNILDSEDGFGRGTIDGSDKNIRMLPNQIKALFLSREATTANNWVDNDIDYLLDAEMYEMLRYNFFTLQKIEFLSGFDQSPSDGSQISSPVFSALTSAALDTITSQNASMLCRMTTYKNSMVYADIPKEATAPIRDEYFIINFSGITTAPDPAVPLEQPDTTADLATERLADETSLTPGAARLLTFLMTNEKRNEFYNQFASTVFITQPEDPIAQGAEILSTTKPAASTVAAPGARRVLVRPTAVAPTTTTAVPITTATTPTTTGGGGGGTGGGGGY